MAAKRKKTSSRKKRKSTVKLPLSVVITLIIIVAIIAGVWAALHPYEAKYYVQTWTEQFLGWPIRSQQPAQPIPSNATSDNLAFGIPGKADCIIDREGYALGYSEEHEQAIWVIYRMTYEEATTKVTSRNDNFREDPEIPRGSATLADYRGSGYDRGHMAPSADMTFSVKTMDESFYLSNMSPQLPECNRGPWKDLEAKVRDFAIKEKDVYIVTGPILTDTNLKTIGPNKVTVPKRFYKVVWDRTPPEKMIGFILPNSGSTKRLQEFAVTVDEIELETGLDFFSELPKEQQEALESTLTVSAWQW